MLSADPMFPEIYQEVYKYYLGQLDPTVARNQDNVNIMIGTDEEAIKALVKEYVTNIKLPRLNLRKQNALDHADAIQSDINAYQDALNENRWG